VTKQVKPDSPIATDVSEITTPPDKTETRVRVEFAPTSPLRGHWDVELGGALKLVVTDDGFTLTDTATGAIVMRMTKGDDSEAVLAELLEQRRREE
jgi:hypothetical protein